VGVLILGVINTLLVGTVSPYWQGMVKGLIILLAVLIQREQARR
jgi:ribose transport system permease protein